jgi:hypothetical protein
MGFHHGFAVNTTLDLELGRNGQDCLENKASITQYHSIFSSREQVTRIFRWPLQRPTNVMLDSRH